jgi:circadian clock protein KaiB
MFNALPFNRHFTALFCLDVRREDCIYLRGASLQSMDSSYRSTCHQKKRAAKLQTAKVCSAAKSGGKHNSWSLRLYIAGQTTKSISAIANLKRFCEHHMPVGYHVEVIDLMRKPHLARHDQIVAIPTLIRSTPGPVKRVFGDLSATEQVLLGLDLRV